MGGGREAERYGVKDRLASISALLTAVWAVINQ